MKSISLVTFLIVAALATTSDALWCACKKAWLQPKRNDVSTRACSEVGLTWYAGDFGGCDVGDVNNDGGKANLDKLMAKCKAIDSNYDIKVCS
jgi:hypothetical protein